MEVDVKRKLLIEKLICKIVAIIFYMKVGNYYSEIFASFNLIIQNWILTLNILIKISSNQIFKLYIYF